MRAHPDLKRQSDVIRALRAPLMLLVVFIHVPFASDYGQVLSSPTLSGLWFYGYISKLISYTLGHIAVPTFFFISGYYLFYKSQNWLRQEVYFAEIKKRIRTLLIPYIIWIGIPFILGICLDLVKAKGHLSLEFYWMPLCSLKTLTTVLLDSSSNFPLWYLRDLIIITLFAPLIYFIVHRPFHIFLLLLILFIVFYPLDTPTFRGVLYVTLGAYMGCRHINVIMYLDRIRFPLLLLFAVATILLPFVAGAPYHYNLIQFYIPLGVASTLLLGAYAYDKSLVWRRWMLRAEESVFFVYVAHEVLILSFVKGILYKIGWLSTVPGYFLCGVIVYGICLCGYYILKRLIPSVLAISLGGRI